MEIVRTNTQGASGSLNEVKKEIKEKYLMQKIPITSLVLTTAGLQMDALRAVGSIENSTSSRHIRTESFRFENVILTSDLGY